MGKLEFKYVSLEEVRPYAGNARTHSKKQIRQIADSIERFGFVNPIIVSSDHEVIAGHGRVAAAKLLGMASVPIVVLASMTEAEHRRIALIEKFEAWGNVERLPLRECVGVVDATKSLPNSGRPKCRPIE